MTLEFGLFSHLEKSSGSPAMHELYAEHLDFLDAAEQAGFWGYHLAEHHNTPLNMAPSPGLFLAAASQRTKRLRLGPMVYLLPFYHPLRLIEEIAMLDNLTGGRLEVGVGRGISPFEHALFRNPTIEGDTREMFEEGLDVVLKGLTSERLSHRGNYYHFAGVPTVLRPRQQPHPPLWCGVGTEDTAEFAAKRGMNVTTLAPAPVAARAVAVYREKLRQEGKAERMVGLTRMLVVGPTDAEAERVARCAYEAHKDNIQNLWHFFHVHDMRAGHEFDVYRGEGCIIFGSPSSVLDQLAGQLEQVKPNYLMLNMNFGGLSAMQSRQSLELFATKVKLELSKVPV